MSSARSFPKGWAGVHGREHPRWREDAQRLEGNEIIRSRRRVLEKSRQRARPRRRGGPGGLSPLLDHYLPLALRSDISALSPAAIEQLKDPGESFDGSKRVR